MTKDEVLAIIRSNNPLARADEVAMYADCYCDYKEAAGNIEKNGNIVSHPRTGAPIENPYLKVKASAMSQLRKLSKIKKVDGLWD